jgi:transcriptional regulator MraZ
MWDFVVDCGEDDKEFDMFRGIAAINLDSKGRFAVPTRYRQHLQETCNGQLVLTIDTEAQCCLLYPLPEWEVIESKLQSLPSFNPSARRIQRLLIGHATELELDSNGRLLIPTLLRDYAALEKRVMLVGQGKKFELWDEQQWEAGREQWLAQGEGSAVALPDELQTLSL